MLRTGWMASTTLQIPSAFPIRFPGCAPSCGYFEELRSWKSWGLKTCMGKEGMKSLGPKRDPALPDPPQFRRKR